VPTGRYDPLAVSAWQRISDELISPRVKSVANYQNSGLALLRDLCAGGASSTRLIAD
jgi:hypothetical protein